MRTLATLRRLRGVTVPLAPPTQSMLVRSSRLSDGGSERMAGIPRAELEASSSSVEGGGAEDVKDRRPRRMPSGPNDEGGVGVGVEVGRGAFVADAFRNLPQAAPSSYSPQVPLCERVAGWTSARAAVRAFYDEARRIIREEVQDSLSVDGGPTRSDLELELEYFMEDAVVGWREGREGQGVETSSLCSLRMELDDLRALWGLRVEKRLPLQYLIHSAFWRDMVLSVGQGVLIPRPETELMIDYVLEAVDSSPRLGRGLWADLGTGSGALAVGVARALPLVPTVYAADVAPEPLAYVSFNAQRYGVGHRVRPIESNWFEGLRRAGVSAGSLAGIVSNPPYIPSSTCETLQAEVKGHEPVLALDGGAELAVDCLVPICKGAADMLTEGGFLALETNGGEQAQYILDLLREYGFREVAIRRDLRSVDRFVTAIR